MVKISVIIPIYKVELYLDQCIQSVFSQSYKNLEIILVDDGSPDGCGKMCDKYAEVDSRVCVIHKRNGGLSSARNAGLNIASGDYIMFVDSDDYIDTRMCELLLHEIQSKNSEISFCRISSDTDGNIKEYNPGDFDYSQNSTLSGEEYLRLILCSKIENASWNKIYRRECFNKVRFREGRNNEDFLMFYELLPNVQKITIIGSFLYYYRQRPESIVYDKNNYLFFDIIKNIEEVRNDILEKNLPYKDEIMKREIEERLLFVKTLLISYDIFRYFKKFLINYYFILKLPWNIKNSLSKNSQRVFCAIKLFPMFYLIRRH